jgi:hypothetical protein
MPIASQTRIKKKRELYTKGAQTWTPQNGNNVEQIEGSFSNKHISVRTTICNIKGCTDI